MTAAHEKGFFTEEDSVEVVTSRNANAHDERLEFAMEVITRKLHEAVKETRAAARRPRSRLSLVCLLGGTKRWSVDLRAIDRVLPAAAVPSPICLDLKLSPRA